MDLSACINALYHYTHARRHSLSRSVGRTRSVGQSIVYKHSLSFHYHVKYIESDESDDVESDNRLNDRTIEENMFFVEMSSSFNCSIK